MKLNLQLILIQLLALELTVANCAPLALGRSDSSVLARRAPANVSLILKKLSTKLVTAFKSHKSDNKSTSTIGKVCARSDANGGSCELEAGTSTTLTKAEQRKKDKEAFLAQKAAEKAAKKQENAAKHQAHNAAVQSDSRASEMYGQCPPGFEYRADGRITVSGIDVCWALITSMESGTALTDPVPITNTAPDGSTTISKVSRVQSWDERKAAEKQMVTNWLNGGGLAQLKGKVGNDLAYLVIRGPAHRTTGTGAATQFNGAHLTAVAGPKFDNAAYQAKESAKGKKAMLALYIKASNIAAAPHLYLKNSPTTADKMEMNTEVTGSTTISTTDYS